MTVLVATASAAPCKDKAACERACDAGDPVACVLQSKGEVRPLADDKSWKKSCDDRRDVCGAHHWDGVGTKRDRAAALALWEEGCVADDRYWTCLAYAKATEASQPDVALEHYRKLCTTRSIDLACRAAGRIWKRTDGDIKGVKYSIELPGVMRSFTKEHPTIVRPGDLFFLWSSPMMPSVEIGVGPDGLTCTTTDNTTSPSEAAKIQLDNNKKWMPAKWGARICGSLRPR